jgi:hypothetical protein
MIIIVQSEQGNDIAPQGKTSAAPEGGRQVKYFMDRIVVVVSR